MLSGLTNLLFGTSAAAEQPENDHPQTDQSQEQPELHADCHLKTRPADDEWVLVDRSRGHSPQRMEPNPMENLLIEHPSMSVYGARGRQSSTGTDSNHSESSSDNETAAPERPSVATRGMLNQRHPPRRANALASRAGLVTQAQVVRSVHTAQLRQHKRQMSRNRMERTNKVREVYSRGKQQRRRNTLRQPTTRSSYNRC